MIPLRPLTILIITAHPRILQLLPTETAALRLFIRNSLYDDVVFEFDALFDLDCGGVFEHLGVLLFRGGGGGGGFLRGGGGEDGSGRRRRGESKRSKRVLDRAVAVEGEGREEGALGEAWDLEWVDGLDVVCAVVEEEFRGGGSGWAAGFGFGDQLLG
jgi:hypothetical protein